MSRYEYSNQAAYDLIYVARVSGQPHYTPGNAVRYHYHRNHGFPWHEKIADWLVDTSGFDLTRIAIIGAGFPWTHEALFARGRPLGSVASQDSGSWVQDPNNNSETSEHRAEIQRVGLDPDAGRGAALMAQMDGGLRIGVGIKSVGKPISSGGGRSQVRQRLSGGGGRPTFCYSEMVIESLWDVDPDTGATEILDFTDDMKDIGNASTTVAHIVVTRRRNHFLFDIRPLTGLGSWREYFNANGHADVVLIDATSFEVG